MSAVRLTVVSNQVEAEVLCGLLRSNGIRCAHRWTDAGAGAWDATGMGGPTEIVVAEADFDEARELLQLQGPS